ncbi:MAG: hypothetical protein EZS28_007117 [Streblomastix strix]|uniref:Tyr recombinase domain-containing protein n=1 Tax=Streblomastix strix TaxID=222440 RepID=A0A5J4WSF9_9EUKA|nr:MAG: hypothetical protein EZS28_007117 [Streblomastix strix]
MIPRVLNMINRDQIEALLILPQWCIYKFKQLLPKITSQIDLGPSQLVLDPGPKMKVLELKLPPGNSIVLRVTNSGTVNILIANMNIETWRKRRSDLPLLDDYLQTVIIPITSLIGDRPDIILLNALNQVKNQNQTNKIQQLKSLRIHGSVTLSQFSKMTNVSHSPLIRDFTKGEHLTSSSNPRLKVVWNLDILLQYVTSDSFSSSYDVQLVAIALLVAYTATRMTELCRFKLQDITSSDSGLNLETEIFKGGKIVQETIRLRRHESKCCPVQALNAWLNIRKNIKVELNTQWLDIENKKEAAPSFCSKQLTNFIRRAGIGEHYTGPTIRHAMMTKLRANGAIKAEVNVWTRHSITSDVIDTFYFKPVERDLGEIMANISMFYQTNHQLDSFANPNLVY